MGKEAKEQRRVELGEVAYGAYRKRLAVYQPEKCLEWHRVPPYMRDVWAAVAEAVIAKAVIAKAVGSQILGSTTAARIEVIGPTPEVERVARIGVKRARKGNRRG
jgi:hypothetical protein